MKMRRFFLVVGVMAVAVAGFAIGRVSGDQPVVPERVKRVFPSLPPPPPDSPAPVAEKQPAVLIEVPAEGTEISGAFQVAGRFLDDGRSLKVVLKDSNGRHLFETDASGKSTAGSDYGRFTAEIPELSGVSGNIVIEVMSQQPDGPLTGPDAVRLVSIPIPEELEVKVFFNNDRLDPVISCTRTYPVTRRIDYQGNPHLAAVEALLEGPTEEEIASGYATSLPDSTEVHSVTVDSQGVAKADFNDSLSRGVAGSCLVSAIRAQVAATLEQFTDVKEVIITVNGESESVLQP